MTVATKPRAPKKKRITLKQRKFIRDYLETGNATLAARNNYGPTTYLTERAIGYENLTKPHIQEELKRLGFDPDNARRVVSEILNNEEINPATRLSAADMVFKVRGTYAAEKHVNVNIEAAPIISELTKKINDVYRTEGEHKDDVRPILEAADERRDV